MPNPSVEPTYQGPLCATGPAAHVEREIPQPALGHPDGAGLARGRPLAQLWRSARVIEGDGGVLHERFIKPAAYGATPGLRYRIALA